jgi:Tol biopolymer transport system component
MPDLKSRLERDASSFPPPSQGLHELAARRARRDLRRRISAGVTAAVIGVLGVTVLWLAFVSPVARGPAGTPTVSNGSIAFAIGEIGGSFEGAKIGSVEPDGSRRSVLAEGITDFVTGGWSPDGSRIVFLRQADDLSTTEIWVMAADGTDPRRLTDGSGLDQAPQWSPTGDQIAFVRHGADRVETSFGSVTSSALWVMNADGSDPHSVVTNDRGASITFFSWSPDGTQFAYGSYGRGPEGIFTTEADGSNRRHVFEGSGGTILWSPDGSELLFDSTLGISIMNADGSKLRTLIGGEQMQRYAAFRWSPDGEQILYVRPVEESREDQLWVIDADGSNERLVAEDLTWRSEGFAWSPDGAFVTFERGGDIWTAALDGSGERRLTSSADFEHSPAWASRGPRPDRPAS